MMYFKVNSLPESAGAYRAWRNSFIPSLMALDRSPENFCAFHSLDRSCGWPPATA